MWSSIFLVPIFMIVIFFIAIICIGVYRQRMLRKHGRGVSFWPDGHCDNRCYTVYITDPRIFPPGSTYPIRTPDVAYPGYEQQPYFAPYPPYPSTDQNLPPRPPPPYSTTANA